jgi:hypothetical protein
MLRKVGFTSEQGNKKSRYAPGFLAYLPLEGELQLSLVVKANTRAYTPQNMEPNDKYTAKRTPCQNF